MPGLRRFSLVALALADRWPRDAGSPGAAAARRKLVDGLRADWRWFASRGDKSAADKWFEEVADELEKATHD